MYFKVRLRIWSQCALENSESVQNVYEKVTRFSK